VPERVGAVVVGIGGWRPGGDREIHRADLVVVEPLLLGSLLGRQQHRLPLVLEDLAGALLHDLRLVVVPVRLVGHLRHPAAYRLEVFPLVARLALDAAGDLQLGLGLVLGVAVLIGGAPSGRRRVVVDRVGKHLR